MKQFKNQFSPTLWILGGILIQIVAGVQVDGKQAADNGLRFGPILKAILEPIDLEAYFAAKPSDILSKYLTQMLHIGTVSWMSDSSNSIKNFREQIVSMREATNLEEEVAAVVGKVAGGSSEAHLKELSAQILNVLNGVFIPRNYVRELDDRIAEAKKDFDQPKYFSDFHHHHPNDL